MSVWPTLRITSRLRKLFAATKASTVVPFCWAMAKSESPCLTTYCFCPGRGVDCAAAVGATVDATVGCAGGAWAAPCCAAAGRFGAGGLAAVAAGWSAGGWPDGLASPAGVAAAVGRDEAAWPRNGLMATPIPTPARRNKRPAERSVSRTTAARPKRAFQCSPLRRCAEGLG